MMMDVVGPLPDHLVSRRQRFLPEERVERLTNSVGGWVPEQQFRGRVPAAHAAVWVGREDRILGGLDKRAQALERGPPAVALGVVLEQADEVHRLARLVAHQGEVHADMEHPPVPVDASLLQGGALRAARERLGHESLVRRDLGRMGQVMEGLAREPGVGVAEHVAVRAVYPQP